MVATPSSLLISAMDFSQKSPMRSKSISSNEKVDIKMGAVSLST